MDAITLLKADHRAVEGLFKAYERSGVRAKVERRSLVDRMVEDLSAHAAIEEQVLYPAVRATVPGTEAMTLESLEEHHIIKWVTSELDHMDPDDERFDAKVTVLIETVRHHVKEEEKDLFPKVRDELGRKALADLGDALRAAKRAAPTHPHPRLADEPPANVLAGAASAVADRIGDSISGVAQGSMIVIEDLIATLLERKKPRVSPTGTRSARRVATKVRSDGARAERVARTKLGTLKAAGVATTGRARRTAKAAERGATSTQRAASAGAKRTSTSTHRAAKPPVARASAQAKRGATTAARTTSRTARATGRTAARSTGHVRNTARSA